MTLKPTWCSFANYIYELVTQISLSSGVTLLPLSMEFKYPASACWSSLWLLTTTSMGIKIPAGVLSIDESVGSISSVIVVRGDWATTLNSIFWICKTIFIKQVTATIKYLNIKWQSQRHGWVYVPCQLSSSQSDIAVLYLHLPSMTLVTSYLHLPSMTLVLLTFTFPVWHWFSYLHLPSLTLAPLASTLAWPCSASVSWLLVTRWRQWYSSEFQQPDRCQDFRQLKGLFVQPTTKITN